MTPDQHLERWLQAAIGKDKLTQALARGESLHRIAFHALWKPEYMHPLGQYVAPLEPLPEIEP